MRSKVSWCLFIAAAVVLAAAPARADVTVTLTLPAGQERAEAQRQIETLLGPDAARQSSEDGVRYTAPAWSAKIDAAQRREDVAVLSAALGDKIRIVETSAATTTPVAGVPPAATQAPSDRVEKSLQAVGAMTENLSAGYDGAGAHNGALAAPAAAVLEPSRPSSGYVPPEKRMSLEKPLPSGVELDSLDRSVSPCADFYQFACGGWMAKNPIPPDQSRWGRLTALHENNMVILKDILQKASSAVQAKSEDDKKLGDLYASCMDEKGVDAKGASPLKPEFDHAARLAGGVRNLAAQTAYFHRSGIPVLFGFGAETDFQNAKMTIGSVDQGGIGLPDRDYYLKADHSGELKAYGEHVTKMFILAGDSSQVAQEEAARVIGIETALAKISMDRITRRDPTQMHTKMSLADFEALTPSFDWTAYFAALGAPKMASIDINSLPFFTGLEKVLTSASSADWKSYLRWQAIHGRAEMLSTPFVSEDFAFFGKKLSGQQQLTPRWKRCVNLADKSLGDALGRDFVAHEFDTRAKAASLGMIAEIEAAMKADISGAVWMSPLTQEKALVKLSEVSKKIGYPDKWRDYSSLSIRRGDAFGNADRVAAFAARRDLAKIGKPVDKNEWEMTPPTVNAYYSPEQNNINFPAGILQPPFFDPKVDNAFNMGAIGAVVGHELTHGFDDEGRRFDGHGNLADWWTAEDQVNFKARAKGLVDQYSAFVAVKDPGGDREKDVHVSGELTLGENTADNGGIRLAYAAYVKEQANNPSRSLDGFTPQQRFFLGWGQAWCTNQRPEATKLRVRIDPHSPPEARVDCTLSNMAEFKQAFQCQSGDAMVNPNPARVW